MTSVEKVERNRIDILGYDCKFFRVPFGRRYKYGSESWVYCVVLNDVFVGVILMCRSNIWPFICLTPDNDFRVFTGHSRVEAVRSYVLAYFLKDKEV